MPRETALLQLERLLLQFDVVWPDMNVLRTAVHGSAMHELPWFGALLWAHAEAHGVPEIISEDFEHGRHYGRTRVVSPFLASAGGVHELPALYEPATAGPKSARRRGRLS